MWREWLDDRRMRQMRLLNLLISCVSRLCHVDWSLQRRHNNLFAKNYKFRSKWFIQISISLFLIMSTGIRAKLALTTHHKRLAKLKYTEFGNSLIGNYACTADAHHFLPYCFVFNRISDVFGLVHHHQNNSYYYSKNLKINLLNLHFSLNRFSENL